MGGADPFGFTGGGGGLGRPLRRLLRWRREAVASAAVAAVRRRAPTSRSTVEIDFEEAVFGAEAPGHGPHRHGVRRPARATGAQPGTSADTCGECGGVGQVRRVRQSLLGQMVTTGPCGTCGGWGKVIETPVRRLPVARAARSATSTLHRRHPGRRRHRLHPAPPNLGAVGPRGGGAGRPLRPRAGAPPRPLRAPRRRAARGALGAAHPGRPRRPPRLRDARRHRGAGAAPRHPVGSHLPLPRQGRAPRAEPRAAATWWSASSSPPPTTSTKEQEELLRQLAELREEPVAPAETGLFSKVRSKLRS